MWADRISFDPGQISNTRPRWSFPSTEWNWDLPRQPTWEELEQQVFNPTREDLERLLGLAGGMTGTINKSYLTAISRTKPSAPMQWLNRQGLLKGKVLDYGSGKGKDADFFKTDRYDPHYAPQKPVGTYDTITSNYVLNVLEGKDRQGVIDAIKKLLNPGGRAYMTVRKDIKKPGFTSRGTYQDLVDLDLPIVRETPAYRIYEMINGLEK